MQDNVPIAKSHVPNFHHAGLRGKLPKDIRLPPSITIPFASFEQALKQRENKDVARRLEATIKKIPTTNAEEKLEEVREICMEVFRHPIMDLFLQWV